jgi:hypothetical protein
MLINAGKLETALARSTPALYVERKRLPDDDDGLLNTFPKLVAHCFTGCCISRSV